MSKLDTKHDLDWILSFHIIMYSVSQKKGNWRSIFLTREKKLKKKSIQDYQQVIFPHFV